MPTTTFGVITDIHTRLDQDASQSYGDSVPKSTIGKGWRIQGYDNTSVPLALATWDAHDVPFAIDLGDTSSDIYQYDEPGRIASYTRYKNLISSSGTGYGTTKDFYHVMGNWDAPNAASTPSDYDLYFDNDDGLGSFFSGLDVTLQNFWWPVNATDGLPIAYTFIRDGFMFICFNTHRLTVSGETQTQLEWIADRFEEADALSMPTIILSHAYIQSPYQFEPNSSSYPAGKEEMAALFEEQIIPPICLAGHTHSLEEIYEQNKVAYIEFRGDLWGYSETDTDRFSHAIVTITSPEPTDDETIGAVIEIQGFGFQSNLSFSGGGSDTDVLNEVVLQTPISLVTGDYLNPGTGETEAYSLNELQNVGTIEGNTVINPQYNFIGPITISFATQYPLKTYPDIATTSNHVVGNPTFGYQSDKAEIRYTLSGRNVTSKSTLYKGPITLNHNTAGSDGVILKYKVYYKGKASKAGTININIKKTDSNFYSINEDG